MGESRCFSLMKCLLILFNVIFLLVGAGVAAFAGWALWDGRGTESGSGRAGLCALAVWAAVLTLGAITAIAGAVRGSGALLAVSFGLVALSAGAGAAAGWWGAAHVGQLRGALAAALRHSLRHEYGTVHARTAALDAIQRGLRCCGADGVRDWQRAAPADLDLSVGAPPAVYTVPASCCERAGEACEAARRVAAGGETAGLWAAGCAGRAADALAEVARAPLAVAAALLAMHGAALLLTLTLCLRARPPPHYKA
ncbi:leukocyte antigen CD37-like [Aricia agestis]|uniref:leukocyte antigen CD37-like n=1 Tax=Aricia agestis TaxID=91739 RepID=UPI001C209593|nr:leukocyte antigen CD37-like [Aricia agestis]